MLSPAINYPLMLAAVGCMLLSSLYFGLHKKQPESTEGFFQGHRGLGLGPLFLTLLATQVGGGTLMGVAKEASTVGFWAIGYSLGQALGLLALGAGLGAKLHRMKVATTAEIFEVKYGSPLLRYLASLLSLASLMGILIAMVIAARTFLCTLGITQELPLIITWLILVTYTVFGGFESVVKTDILQMIIIIIALLASIGYALLSHVDFLPTLWEYDLAQGYAVTHHKLAGWILMPFFFTFTEQDMAQRCFAGKSPRIVNMACVAAGLALIVLSFIPVAFGMVAKLDPQFPHANPFMLGVMQTTNPVFAALVACAVLAAIISTADSLLIAMSANICQDFPFFARRNMGWAKMLTAAIGSAALACSYLSDDIFMMLMESYALSAGCLAVPILIATLNEGALGTSYWGAWGGVLSGLLAVLLLGESQLTWAPPKALAIILISLAGFIISHLWASYKPSKSHHYL